MKSLSSSIKVNLPKDLVVLLDFFVKEIIRITDKNLLGCYVYGSISYGDFDVERSDVDLIVLLQIPLKEQNRNEIRNWLSRKDVDGNKWIDRLEVDFISKEDFIPTVKNIIYTDRISSGKLRTRRKYHGVAIDLQNVKDCGIVLFGKSPNESIPTINKMLLFDALKSIFLQLKTESKKWVKANLWNQSFLVIQLCRVMYGYRNNCKPVSKKKAIIWCLDNVPEKFHSMIRIAQDKIVDYNGPLEKEITNNIDDFLGYIENQIRGRIIQ